VGITVGCQNFEGFFAVNFVDFDNRNIESTTTQVINRDSTVASTFVQTVSQRSCGRFVDDTFYFQTSDTACVFGSVDPELINWAKLGILVGSISSVVIGYSWLRVRLRPSV
jgi:hypothetical protein